MDERIIQMCEETAGVRITHMSTDDGLSQWTVETLERDQSSAREWGSGHTIEDALAFCYGAFTGYIDVRVDSVREPLTEDELTEIGR